MELGTQLGLALAIVGGSFVSEDAAVLSAATLAATSMLDGKLALASAVTGVSLGDCGLFAVARLASRGALRWGWAQRMLSSPLVARCRRWCERHARAALFFSRAIPGTRLPMTLACGLFNMPPPQFVAISLAGASAWVLATFAFVHFAQARAGSAAQLWLTLALALLSSIGCGFLVRAMFPRIEAALCHLRQWEFWPAWLFYLPVVAMCARLAIRYRSISLPALANPGQLNGGIIGESKAEILNELRSVAPDHVAAAFLLGAGDPRKRNERVKSLLDSGRLDLPFVMKPNVAQRGAGFRVVRSLSEAMDYLSAVPSDVVAQRYAPGPGEAGIFYYRMPGSSRGEILSITDKVFPYVCGDGVHTLRQLIESDARASRIAATYLKRFHERSSQIVPHGQLVRLVEAGNHCQGCIFRDGSYLYSETLRSTIDHISQDLKGFYIGRFDVRFAADEDLRAGRFTIIELNGAASEATSIYDARTSLWSAYRMLYRQWGLVFEIGDRNRRLGLQAPSIFSLWAAWREYNRLAAAYPLAD